YAAAHKVKIDAVVRESVLSLAAVYPLLVVAGLHWSRVFTPRLPYLGDDLFLRHPLKILPCFYRLHDLVPARLRPLCDYNRVVFGKGVMRKYRYRDSERQGKEQRPLKQII